MRKVMKVKQKLLVEYLRARLNILAILSKEKAAEEAFTVFSSPAKKQKKENPPIYAKAEKLSFDMDGMRIKGFRWNSGAKKKMLIIHGFNSNSRNFSSYIEALVNSGIELFAFDAPAHGKSGGKTTILPQYVQMLQYVHTLYGSMHGYIAHSFGGLALAHFLENYPHDKHLRAVLIAPATETKSAIDHYFKLLQLKINIRKEFDELILRKGGVPADHYSIRRTMKNIHASVLWFHDLNDDITPFADAKKVEAENFPNLKFIATSGLGHSRIYRDEKVIAQTLQFLLADNNEI